MAATLPHHRQPTHAERILSASSEAVHAHDPALAVIAGDKYDRIAMILLATVKDAAAHGNVRCKAGLEKVISVLNE